LYVAARQQNGDRQRLIMYTKMVCVMGFTWAAGFLAAFTGEAALWWVYIVLNGLQVSNEVVLKINKNKFGDLYSAYQPLSSGRL
jgi:low temperature requirement protein LtrA